MSKNPPTPGGTPAPGGANPLALDNEEWMRSILAERAAICEAARLFMDGREGAPLADAVTTLLAAAADPEMNGTPAQAHIQILTGLYLQQADTLLDLHRLVCERRALDDQCGGANRAILNDDIRFLEEYGDVLFQHVIDLLEDSPADQFDPYVNAQVQDYIRRCDLVLVHNAENPPFCPAPRDMAAALAMQNRLNLACAQGYRAALAIVLGETKTSLGLYALAYGTGHEQRLGGVELMDRRFYAERYLDFQLSVAGYCEGAWQRAQAGIRNVVAAQSLKPS